MREYFIKSVDAHYWVMNEIYYDEKYKLMTDRERRIAIQTICKRSRLIRDTLQYAILSEKEKMKLINSLLFREHSPFDNGILELIKNLDIKLTPKELLNITYRLIERNDIKLLKALKEHRFFQLVEVNDTILLCKTFPNLYGNILDKIDSMILADVLTGGK